MYQFTYEQVNENDNPTEIAFHNMKVGDDVHNLGLFIGGQSGYFNANPDKTFQDLELELRERNFNTHLIAKHPSVDTTSGKFILGMRQSNGKITTDGYIYECITSCRPRNYALEEVLQTWKTYEENFEALKEAGTVMVTNSKMTEEELNNEVIDNGTTKVIDNKNPINLMSENKVKAIATYVPASEVIDNICKQIFEKTGKQPTLSMCSINERGGPILAITLDNKIVSNVGLCIEYDSNGAQIMKLVNL